MLIYKILLCTGSVLNVGCHQFVSIPLVRKTRDKGMSLTGNVAFYW